MPHEPNDPASSPVPSQRRADGYAPSAMPSKTARAVAFVSILLGGFCGGVIGYALAEIESYSTISAGISVLVGAIGSAVGIAVVATLSLRAMTEWRIIEHTRRS